MRIPDDAANPRTGSDRKLPDHARASPMGGRPLGGYRPAGARAAGPKLEPGGRVNSSGRAKMGPALPQCRSTNRFVTERPENRSS
jgi:hypothetical protein